MPSLRQLLSQGSCAGGRLPGRRSRDSRQQRTMKASPVGRLVASLSWWPWLSTAPPTMAAAPFNIGPRNGSTVVALPVPQAAIKSGAKKWRSTWARSGRTVMMPVASRTRAPASGVNAGGVGLPPPVLAAPGGRRRRVRGYGKLEERRVKGSAGLMLPGRSSTSKRNSSISSSQRARKRLMSRSLPRDRRRLERTPGGRGAPLPRR